MTAPQGVTLPRRRLGTALRELREAAGLSRERVGHALDCSSSKISRIENGDVGVRRNDLMVMLNLYGVTDALHRQSLIELARESKTRAGWWMAYRRLLSHGESRFLELEAAASAIDGYGLATVPDLLQTRRYAEADIAAGYPGATAEHLAQRLEIRLARQALLDGDRLDELRLVLDEATLHRTVGDSTVMAEQLRHLVRMRERSAVTLQVLPFGAGSAGVRTGFTLLRFTGDGGSTAVYLDSPLGESFLERPEEVRQAAAAFRQVREHALDPAESARCIEGLLPPVR